MRGVGDELALGVHGGVERAHRALQRVEHRVEALREAPDLIFARGLDPVGEVLRAGDVLGGLGQALDRRHRGAGDEPSEQRGQRDPADVEQHQDQAQARERAVHVGQRLGELGGIAVRYGLAEDAQVDAVGARVLEERFPAVRGEAERPGADRQSHVGRGGEPDLAVGVDQLLVAAHLVGVRAVFPGKAL